MSIISEYTTQHTKLVGEVILWKHTFWLQRPQISRLFHTEKYQTEYMLKALRHNEIELAKHSASFYVIVQRKHSHSDTKSEWVKTIVHYDDVVLEKLLELKEEADAQHFLSLMRRKEIA